MRAASILVDVPVRTVASPFTYEVPAHLSDEVRVGSVVAVEFGSRVVVGYVLGVPVKPEVDSLKPILQVLTSPLFDSVSASVAMWMAEEYCSPPAEAIRLFLPPGGTPRIVRDEEAGSWRLKPPTAAPVDVRWVARAEGSDFSPRASAHLQRALLDAVSAGPVSVPELRAELGSVDAALRRLEQAGAIETFERRAFRSVEHAARPAPRHESLTAGQVRALDAIVEAPAGAEVLLDGVTGSGKTEVYLRSIENVRSSGRAAIVLVPEISLTPQTVGRFRARFGDDIAVLHSRLSMGERLDEWDRIASGRAGVVIGARSALFAPVRDLGLVVIDEEHSSSYKQGQAPRYDARDVARYLVSARGCALVTGSATPSLEALHRASTGLATRVVLDERAGGGALPSIEVVDMARAFAEGGRSMFSDSLVIELRRAADQGKRAVLLLNRRGFASFLLCRECGYVPTCDSCSISMTYHDVSGSVLECHHCGARRAVPAACPECESPYLRLFGAGTQRVESELADIVPDVPLVRMDADTTKGKGGHERVLAQFESTPGAFLVGTQMVAKGLDYPDVTVVGVLNADTTLHLPDFRAAERTYQLLAQVAGRAGRASDPGRVVIQTYWPTHRALVAVQRHEPDRFYGPEASEREELGYPPFGRIARVIVSGKDLDSVKQAARDVSACLRSSTASLGAAVLGPSPAPLARLKQQHRWHVLVKAGPDAALPAAVSSALSAVGRHPGVSFAPDIDPADVM